MSKNSYDHACNNTLVQTRDVTDNVRVNNGFLIDIMFNLKIPFQMVILHSRSFHMKLMKLAEGSFHSFHMKLTLV